MGESEEESEHGTKTDRGKKIGKEESGERDRERESERKCFHSAIPASFFVVVVVSFRPRRAPESGRDGVMNQKSFFSIEDRAWCAPSVALFPTFPSLCVYAESIAMPRLSVFPLLLHFVFSRGGEASVSRRTRGGKEVFDGRKNFSGQKKREEEVEGAKVGTL